MPRDGSGRAHNAIEEDDDLQTKAHGTGADKEPELSHTKHVAPPPEPEKGAAIEGLPASGGRSQGFPTGNRGKGGPDEPLVDKIT